MSKLEVSPDLIEALHQLSSLLESEDSLDETLKTIVDLSVATLPGCDSAGVTLRVQGKDMTAAASDDYALEIDKIQYDSGEGPCVEALEQREFRQIEDVAEETRWPKFCGQAATKGFKSSISFPIKSDGTAGALNIYANSTGAFDEAAITIGGVFATQATIALQNAQTYQRTRQLADHLNEALKSRDLIGQAKGILMEREGATDEEAFEMLKTISQTSNVKLRDIAQRLVEEKGREAR